MKKLAGFFALMMVAGMSAMPASICCRTSRAPSPRLLFPSFHEDR